MHSVSKNQLFHGHKILFHLNTHCTNTSCYICVAATANSFPQRAIMYSFVRTASKNSESKIEFLRISSISRILSVPLSRKIFEPPADVLSLYDMADYVCWVWHYMGKTEQ